MVKTSNNSRIEIWKSNYINNADNQRFPEDAIDKVEIVQIEPGNTTNDYIVEVKNKEAFQTPTGEYKYTDTDMEEQYNKGRKVGMNYVLNKIQEEKNNPNTNWDYNQLTAFANFVKKLIMV